MDRDGRVFVGHQTGITAVDSLTHELLWDFTDGDFCRGLAIWEGRIIWGDGAPLSNLYCYDAATGEEVWTFYSDGAYFNAPVADHNGVVYVSDAGPDVVHARRIKDGSEVWTEQVGQYLYGSVALDWPGLLTSSGGPWGTHIVGLEPLTGHTRWVFPTGRNVSGTAAHYNGRVYFGSEDKYLYSLHAKTGEEIWRFWCRLINRGSVAIGHDGTIYTGTTSAGILFAVSPKGDELWRYYLPGLVWYAPIVAGDGTIYVCSGRASPYRGWVHALRPDGTLLWAKQMPDDVRASPMLAPDGTLYVVCRDKYLYAFHDPPNLDKADADDHKKATDVRPVPQP